ncbi:hypothetical protein AGR4A_pAt10303 [Agrobacterium tumefaciens str. B6]|uniref:Uncharacterized protein n=1 Tax=Agrobacterium tumefaciens str. B6 TaxID=1183423 RepID=A0A822V8J6_AGRTU|nr:hypothetical protein AGR4A_pAt10303 [Agrobacterium tumefaciens str. B6]
MRVTGGNETGTYQFLELHPSASRVWDLQSETTRFFRRLIMYSSKLKADRWPTTGLRPRQFSKRDRRPTL